jgi:hypothetical protein
VYLRTLCPTVSDLDSGELISVCYTLGIAHPAGYPLYTLLGRLFTLIPVNSVAFRVNMMSAFFASLAVVLIYLISIRLYEIHQPGRRDRKSYVEKHVIAFSTSLIFAFSRAFWSYAVITEVYTMKAFFLLLVIFMILKWRVTSRSAARNWLLWIGAFIYGLSLGTHITIALFAPVFLVYIFINRDRTSSMPYRTWLVMTLFFMMGFCIYLYLPIRSLSDPPIDWGNPENWRNFLAHITGRQFRFMLFNVNEYSLQVHAKEYLYSFAMQFTFLIYPLGIIGAIYLLKNQLGEFILLAGICLIDIVFNLFLYMGSNWLEHFFISSFSVFAIWAGLGMKLIADWGIEITRRVLKPKRKAILNFGYCAILIMFVILPAFPYTANRKTADRSNNWSSHDYGKNILEFADKNAIIMTNGICSTFPLWYFQYVEGKRPDVAVVDANLLAHPWFGDYLRDKSLSGTGIKFDRSVHSSYDNWINDMVIDFMRSNMGNRTFYFTFKNESIFTRVVESGYFLSPRIYFIPMGPSYRLEKREPEIAVSDPDIQYETRVKFSNLIEFLGYDTENTGKAERGEMLNLAYYWRLLDEIPEDLTVDVFFTDAEGNYVMEYGIPKFHHIHELGYDMPLSDIHEQGTIVKEEYKMVVPSDILPGEYYINIGVCRGTTFLEIDHKELTGNFARVGVLIVL